MLSRMSRFRDLGKHGHGMAMVGLSTALFERCPLRRMLRMCVEDLGYCCPNTSIVVTPPNYSFPADAGGVRNPSNHHVLIPIQAFEMIVLCKAGVVMPIQYCLYA